MISIQQAACDQLAVWLGSQLPGVVVEPRWPAPSKELPRKAVSIIQAGPRKDENIQPDLLSATNSGTTQSVTRWRLKACEQPIQIDVWTKTDPERDDILARLDIALNAGESALTGFFNPMPVGPGVLLKLTGDWADTYADCQFESADITDTPDSTERAEYRATIRGTIYVMLAVTATTARQTVINFNAKLTELAKSNLSATVNATRSTISL